MDLSRFLRATEDDLERALEGPPELSVEVTPRALALVSHDAREGWRGDLRVEGRTVVLVREKDLGRFRQRLREQVALHVPRDEQPDLTQG